MQQTNSEDGLYIDVRQFIDASAESSPEAGALAIDLLVVLWSPAKAPFTWDAKEISDKLNSVAPKRGYTAQKVESLKQEASLFFTELHDGRWAPNPRFFSVSNGNPGSAS